STLATVSCPFTTLFRSEQRNLDAGAGLERGGLVAAAGRSVAAQAGIGLGDLQVDGAGQLDVRRLVVDEEHVDNQPSDVQLPSARSEEHTSGLQSHLNPV